MVWRRPQKGTSRKQQTGLFDSLPERMERSAQGMSKPNNLFATIYTDASYDEKLRIGTYGYYIKCNNGKLEGNGAVKDVHNTVHAEMIAIYKGIKAAIEKWPELPGVFVNTDNMDCCKLMWPWIKHKRMNNINGPPGKVKQLIKQALGKRWDRYKHVKGHTGRDDIRSRVNKIVDRSAHKTLKSARVGGVEVAVAPAPRKIGDPFTFTEKEMEWDS